MTDISIDTVRRRSSSRKCTYFPCPFGCGLHHTQCSSEGFVALFRSTKKIFYQLYDFISRKNIGFNGGGKFKLCFQCPEFECHAPLHLVSPRSQYANFSYRNRMVSLVVVKGNSNVEFYCFFFVLTIVKHGLYSPRILDL